MIRVPAAFKTAPRVPPRDGRYPCKECGSRTWMAYRSGETKRGTKGVMPAPIRWCMYCKGLRHWSGRKIEEQKAWANHYSCLTCSSSTYRLRLWVSDGLTLTLPYAYCVTCDAVADRPIETRGERKTDGVKKCAGCNASISDRYKWCSNCKLRQIYGHGRLGPPQRRVRADEAHIKRNCVECGEEYLPNSGTQRFCTECAAARLRTSRRKPTPKKKPANELEVEIDFSAVVDDGAEAEAEAAAAAAARPGRGGKGRRRGRGAAASAIGALSLIALEAGGGAAPASPIPPPVFDASLPYVLCRPSSLEDVFPGSADRGGSGRAASDPAAADSDGGAAAEPGADAPAKRRPGRPRKTEAAAAGSDAPAKRRPGRPRRAEVEAAAGSDAPAKRRPGRPRRAEVEAAAAAAGTDAPAKRRPGRPRKTEAAAGTDAPAKRRPGRPRRTEVEAAAGSDAPAKRRPGRPRRTEAAGEAADSTGAAPGLRDADTTAGKPRRRGRGRPSGAAAPPRASPSAARRRPAKATPPARAAGGSKKGRTASGRAAAKGASGRRS